MRTAADGVRATSTPGRPKPEEVLSFEFPALPNTTEDLLAGHKFSIRLRVTPVK